MAALASSSLQLRRSMPQTTGPVSSRAPAPASCRPSATAVRVVSLRPGRRCFPAQRFSPGRVRVLFSHQGFPNQQSANGESTQQQQQPVQDRQEQGEAHEAQQDQEQPPAGDSQAPGPSPLAHGQTEQEQQQQQQPSDFFSRCNGRGPFQGPASTDILSPWFPADRSLTEMVNVADRMFGSMLMFGPMGRMGNRTGRRGQQQQQPGGLFSLAMRRPWDVAEDDKAFTLSLDLPGLSKEDVRVRVSESDTLVISAERKDAEDDQDSGKLRSRVTTKFQTQLKLPQNVQKEKISAEMKDGVLKVTVPKIPVEELGGSGIDVPIA